jgi:hypothetical protein
MSKKILYTSFIVISMMLILGLGMQPTIDAAASAFTQEEVAPNTGGALALPVQKIPKPSTNLDQFANGPLASPVPCTGGAWQNGNLNENQAYYLEGESVPYRAFIIDTTVGIDYTITIQYDTTKDGKHALDFLTDFNRTETDADPCSDLSGVPSGACADPHYADIPADPNITNSNIQIPGQNFSIYNGEITAVSGYTLSGDYSGTSSTSITLTFTSTEGGTVVIAWGGHIAERKDWGDDNSAVAIPGSPYHMRLIDFTCTDPINCSAGNQDRLLSAGAVIYPGSITIIKDARPEGLTSFPFTASPSPLVDFSLVDNGTSTNTKIFDEITNFTTYTVTENPPDYWDLTNIVCGVTSSNGGSQSTNISTATATITLAEGENVTCTFTDVQQTGTLTLVKTVDNNYGGTATAGDFQA